MSRHPTVISAPTPKDTVSVEALDWLQLRETAPQARAAIFRLTHADPPNVIIVADCVYNPALLPGLVAALDHYARPGSTQVLVAVELRAEDVVRKFLELWTELGGWEIWRTGWGGRKGDYESDSGDDWLDVNFAVWVGWKIVADSK